jgi:hypothetical protein
MHVADFPRWMRALPLATALLFFWNLVLFFAPIPFQISSFGLRIDPGVATLLGAIIGLGIVAWPAGRPAPRRCSSTRRPEA